MFNLLPKDTIKKLADNFITNENLNLIIGDKLQKINDTEEDVIILKKSQNNEKFILFNARIKDNKTIIKTTYLYEIKELITKILETK